MNYQERINTISKLGQFFKSLFSPEQSPLLSGLSVDDLDTFKEKMEDAAYKNPWFTAQNIERAIQAWGANLSEDNLNAWMNNYPEISKQKEQAKTVGIVMAGNIPLVGFHDFLSVFLSGHYVLAKLATDDQILFEAIFEVLKKINPNIAEFIKFTNGKLENFDAVIATGSNNTSRYFEYYFGKYPNIIRKNRNSIAVLTGEETTKELSALGMDIFQYYGLGCRNVSKLYVPHNYDFKVFFESIQSYSDVGFQSKYVNNYDFNKSIYLVNKVDHFDNGFCLLKEDTALVSPISVIYFEYYTDIRELKTLLESRKDEIQCTVSANNLMTENVEFGKSQKPELMDYADGIDTVKFLMAL